MSLKDPAFPPILFSLFVSDIPSDPTCKLSQFADDLATWATNTKKVNYLLQKFLEILHEWCLKWGLSVNKIKTKVMKIGKQKPEFKIDDTDLEKVETVKFLVSP